MAAAGSLGRRYTGLIPVSWQQADVSTVVQRRGAATWIAGFEGLTPRQVRISSRCAHAFKTPMPGWRVKQCGRHHERIPLVMSQGNPIKPRRAVLMGRQNLPVLRCAKAA